MKRCWLGRVGLLTVIASVGCAQATQGAEAEPSSDNAQAGGLSEHAGAAGNPFQPSAGTSARGGMGGAAGSAQAGSYFGGTSGVAGASFSGAGGPAASTAGAANGGASGGDGGSPSVGGSSIGPGAGGGSSTGASCAPRTFSYPDAGHVLTSVGVSGSFNAWAKVGVPLTYDATEQSWQLAMTLDAGTYQYKFVVNGTTWQADPGNSNSVGDGYGGVNSVIVCS